MESNMKKFLLAGVIALAPFAAFAWDVQPTTTSSASVIGGTVAGSYAGMGGGVAISGATTNANSGVKVSGSNVTTYGSSTTLTGAGTHGNAMALSGGGSLFGAQGSTGNNNNHGH
jgi:hypothetical protein